METCKFRLGFVNCLSVDCSGRSRGLALLWKENINLFVLSYSKSHIDSFIKDVIDHAKDWYLTGAYGHPNTAYRMET